jgi:predicted polyphosphate/ATP-dependent NAD kinase
MTLVVFAGGDGTARDVAGRWRRGRCLGIPCGVKMHSGVFAVSPEAAGAAGRHPVAAPPRGWDDEAEVMDIDEDALRAGRLAPRLYGHARVPVARGPDAGGEGRAAARPGARWPRRRRRSPGMEPGTLYVIGPGTSAGAVMRAAGHEPTLLGVDAMRDGKVVARDARAGMNWCGWRATGRCGSCWA